MLWEDNLRARVVVAAFAAETILLAAPRIQTAGLQAQTRTGIRSQGLRLRRDKANAARGLRSRANPEWGRPRMSVHQSLQVTELASSCQT